MRLKNDIMFPNLPKSIWAIVIPWLAVLGLLFFDSAMNTSTNPVLIFGFPIIMTLVFMPKDSFENIKSALGFSMPMFRDKFYNFIFTCIGGTLGIVLYYLLAVRANIIPLYFIPVSTLSALGIDNQIYIAALYLLVAVSEETMCALWMKNAANSISFNLSWIAGMGAITLGGAVARSFWSSDHWFAYQGWLGLGTLPMFVSAWGLGMLFTLLGLVAARLSGRFYFIMPAIMAHWTFDVFVAMRLALLIG
nr:hypothetical protein 15 [bacterium]